MNTNQDFCMLLGQQFLWNMVNLNKCAPTPCACNIFCDRRFMCYVDFSNYLAAILDISTFFYVTHGWKLRTNLNVII